MYESPQEIPMHDPTPPVPQPSPGEPGPQGAPEHDPPVNPERDMPRAAGILYDESCVPG